MKILLTRIRRILRDRRIRRLFTRFVSTSAAIVVFATTYALVLPAITMESTAACGIEAHQHDDFCYEDVLICELAESPGHQHTDACFSSSLVLVCTKNEHRHEDTCFDADGGLVCTLLEHAHDDDCYSEVRDLTCGLEESEGHAHDFSCYEKVLTCGKEVHVHSEACYETGFDDDFVDDSYDDFGDESYDDFGDIGADTFDAGLEDNGGDAFGDAYEDNGGDAFGDAFEDTGDGTIEEPFEENGDDFIQEPLEVTPENTGGEAFDDADAGIPGDPAGAADEPGGALPEEETPAPAGSPEGASADDSVKNAAGNTDAASTEDASTGGNGDSGSADGAEQGPDDGTGEKDGQNVDDAGGIVPSLDPLQFHAVLDDNTGIYYHAVQEGEEIEDSAALAFDQWSRVDQDTELGKNDLIRVYLSYTIPAGSLNSTNPVARYRMPGNLHLTDAQVEAINSYVNGIAGQYVDRDTLEITDPDLYKAYLGVEAVEGSRRPDMEPDEYLRKLAGADGEGTEYISATVRVEVVRGGTAGDVEGQDLVFTFVPYSFEKNRHLYDEAGQLIREGAEIRGWLTLDFNMSQVDWNDRTADIVFVGEGTDGDGARTHEISTILKLAEEAAAETGVEGSDTDPGDESDESAGREAAEEADEGRTEEASEEGAAGPDANASAEKADDPEKKDPADDDAKKKDTEDPEITYRDGTLTAEGTGYRITLNYTADARIPAGAYLHVTEITRESDAEAYEACLEEAGRSVAADENTMVDDRASRFFDIEILAEEAVTGARHDQPEEALSADDQGAGAPDAADQAAKDKDAEGQGMDDPSPEENRAGENTLIVMEDLSEEEPSTAPDGRTVTRRIEPAAPVVVNIQLFDTELPDTGEGYDADQYKVVHFAQEGPEEIRNVSAQTIDGQPDGASAENGGAGSKESQDAAGNKADGVTPPTEIQFEAESFSIYGVVYTVDFHYEVDGNMYRFSLPGGGFVSFTDLVEVLGIADDTNAGNKADGNAAGEAAEEGAENTDTNTALTLGDVNVSDAARRFVTAVASVEFSSPALVDVSRADTDLTVGQIKENRGLACEYSAELTKEQIAEINAQTVKAGDWALISLQPFTSVETLMVTMKNGEVFTIRVTDYQISAYFLTADGKNYKIVMTYDDDAGIPEGTELHAVEIDPGSDAFIQRLGQAWYEVNKEYFEVEEMRKHYDEGMGDLPDIPLVNLDEVRFFDITLVYEGKEIEPAAPVHVDITYVDGLELSEGSIAGVAHFAESGVELIKDVETSIKDNSVTGFSYEQAGFSDTGTYVGRETYDEVGGPEIAPAPEKTEYPLLNAAAAPQDGEAGGRRGETVDTEDLTDLDQPKGTKTLTPNTSSSGGNDSTYTLTLSVSGTSKSSTETIVSKSNVLIVMDRSSSMINNYVYTYTEHTGSYQSGQQYFGKSGDTYFEVFYNNGRYYRTYNQFGYPRYTNEYTGTRYTRTRKTRLAEEQTALSQLLNQLLSKNGTGTTADGVSLEDIIEVSVISFADQRYSGKDTEVDWTTDYDTLMAGVNKGTYTSGTNWEDALKYALEVANAKQAQASQEGEEMHIIFLTDGEPTAVYGESGGAKHYNNVGGGFVVAYDAAKDDAATLVNAGYHLYNIFTYGTDEDYGYMVRLTNYAYSNGENDTTNEDTDAVRQYFTNAKTTDKLLSAFQNIFSLVSNKAAYGKVSITDGLTTDAMTTTLVHGRAEGYQYTVTGALGELYSVTAVGTVENPTVTFTVNGHDHPGVKKSTEINGVSYDYWSYTAGEGDAAVEYRMTLADVSEDGTLTWDLTGIGTLMDGYTYSAGFVVWPDQDAYDYVAALNNGLPGYAWDTNADTYEDLRTTKGYEKGGVENYPSIVRYGNGVFAVLTNTEQKVQYSIVETKEVDGETTVEYDGPYEFDLPTPEPMPLTGTASQLEKVWNINRDPSILYRYLYESKDENNDPAAVDIGFVIVQDGEEYKEIHLPGNATVTEEGVSYDWSAYAPEDLVEYNGRIFSKRWSREFSIPTGLMLSAAQMEARGLDKSLYTRYSFGGTQYYVLETGHDFTISEPAVGYEFDFEAPAYHPMLVDGVLMDVKFSGEGGARHITGMEPLEINTGTGQSALTVFNTLRGYINLKKKVVDQDGAPLETDDTEFTFEVELTNALPVFEGDSIPWYGINGLYYHDAEGNYYQAEYVNGALQVTTEDGGPYPAAGTAFNPDIVGEQTITYTIDGEEKSVTISGNQMIPEDGNEEDGYKKVTAEVKITRTETLYIANVPVNTQYSIREIARDGYQLVSIERSVGSGTAAGAGSMDTGIVEGEIVQNTETLVTYTNQCLITDITIRKTDTEGQGLAGAVFQMKTVTSGGHEEAMATTISTIGGLGDITKEVNGQTTTFPASFESTGGIQTISGLPDGTYRLYEVFIPPGYVSTFRYIQFTIEDRELKNVTTDTGDTGKLDTTGDNIDLRIANEPGVELPSAGGPGTRLLCLFGILLTGLAGAGLLMRKETKKS